jgi:Inorganic pyrophosphatase/exopolyphosphatase
VSKILIFGHKNPDTDTICSAIAYEYLKKELGFDAEAVALGAVNEETAFALEKFGVSAPRIITNIAENAEKVMLVDHNEFGQSADGIEQVEILEVVDHHRISNFETSAPLYYRAEPVGCTATIIAKMFRENVIAIPAKIAGLLLSAIVSDTLLFKSPTSTKEDEIAARELAAIANVEIESYGLAQLKAGASIIGKTPEELISIDSKPFTMGCQKVEVAQINVVEISDILTMKAEVLAAMETARMAKEQDLFLVLVTDILNNNSVGLLSGDATIVEKAFNTAVENSIIDLPGVVSRKKQVVPQLTEAAE